MWSNISQWPNGEIPQDHEDVIVPGEWTVLMDIQPNIFGNLLIQGDVIVPSTSLDITFKANNIWIQSGSLKAGTSTTPHPGKVTI